MPVADRDLMERSISPEIPANLPFPPVTRSHILNCSYHSWYPRYRALTPKARLIALSTPFLSYLRADGIVLPPEGISSLGNFDNDVQVDQDEEEDSDPSLFWPNIHAQVKSTITELGGSVMPKLNWSAPKDATWISATNSMVCNTPNDVYLLLKSSDFITHDLEQIFDDCDDDVSSSIESGSEEEADEEDTAAAKLKELENISYHLVLRKTVPTYNPSLEFRCFVRSRQLLCMCQRDLNHYTFLPPLIPKLRPLICSFFNQNLKNTFPDESFVFDVYIPPPHGRAWLIDVNPWAPRTDPLLFSWLEILGMKSAEQIGRGDPVANGSHLASESGENNGPPNEDSDGGGTEVVFTPEFRLVNRDDPEAYRFNTPQYSAHKLPKDVVDASNDGEAGLREFMGTWREIVAKQENEARGESAGE